MLRPEACSSSALALLIRLEDQGFEMQVVDGRFRIAPAGQLSASQDAEIREYRDELTQLVEWVVGPSN